MIHLLILYTFTHYLGDYPLQGDYLAQNKHKQFYICFAHCFIYAGLFYIASGFDIKIFVIAFITHLIIDWFMKGILTNKDIDQALHLFVVVVMSLITLYM